MPVNMTVPMAAPVATQGRSRSMPSTTLFNNSSSSNRRQSAFQSFGFKRKSEVDIVIDTGDDFIHSYSTFDEIKGHVNVHFDKDTPIEDFHIWFQGQTSTWVERMAGPSPRTGRATAKHVFLKVQQPIDAVPFSENNIAKAGIHYSIPFKFVVPDRLLPFVCNHTVETGDVKDQHLLLPPSIGEEMIAGEGQTLMDDLAPTMSKVVYSVRARLAKGVSTGRQTDVITESADVRIIPARAEMPPAPVADGPSECIKYQLRTEKNVRKGIFRIGKKQGRLTAETAQPASLMLPHPSRANTAPASTTTTVHLRYDPASVDEQPPQLSSFGTKLKVYTFFGAAPFKHVPAPNKYEIWSAMHGIYPETVNLLSMNLASVTWKKHEADSGTVSTTERRSSVATTTSSGKNAGHKSDAGITVQTTSMGLNRRSSALSDDSDLSNTSSTSETSTTVSSPTSSSAQPTFPPTTKISPSTFYNPALPYYTTSILIPITLPSPTHDSHTAATTATSSPTSSTAIPTKQKTRPTFLPTFHSCLISRTYNLEITLSSQGSNIPTLNLRTPIQLALEPTSINVPASSPPSFPTLSAPVEFYDPFSLSQHATAAAPPPSDYETYNDADSKANDEAIARALESDLNHHRPNHNSSNSSSMERIPEYSELQIQTYPSFPPSSQPRTPNDSNNRRMTLPVLTNAPPLEADNEAPPEYYSSFRRASQSRAQRLGQAQTQAQAHVSGGRLRGLGWSSTTPAPSASATERAGLNPENANAQTTGSGERRGSWKWSLRS